MEQCVLWDINYKKLILIAKLVNMFALDAKIALNIVKEPMRVFNVAFSYAMDATIQIMKYYSMKLVKIITTDKRKID